MVTYLGFSRYQKNKEYIISESNLFEIVEADFEKMQAYAVGQGIFFKGGILSLSDLMYNQNKSDWGIYSIAEFFFYFMAVTPDEGISYKNVANRTIVALFKPFKILYVINILVEKIVTLNESGYDETEISQLNELQTFLTEAQKIRI